MRSSISESRPIEQPGLNFYNQFFMVHSRISSIIIYLVIVASLCQCNSSDNNKGVGSTKSPVVQAQESIEKMVVQEGFEVKLVASEPLVKTPIALDFDAEGRIWVLEMNSYEQFR